MSIALPTVTDGTDDVRAIRMSGAWLRLLDEALARAHGAGHRTSRADYWADYGADHWADHWADHSTGLLALAPR